MIISRTPFRISFFGGGTDYKPWFTDHGGAVLSTTINKYCYISCRYLPPFFNYNSRIVWSQIEVVNDNSQIVHPVVREVLKMLELERVQIHHEGDLPSRAGLGSSSSFTVGLINALRGMMGNISPKELLAKTAIHVEQNLLAESVGIQDQIAVAYGGFNKIEIFHGGGFQVVPITINQERLKKLESNLILLYTGISRTASEIASEKIKAIPQKRTELHRMRAMVDDAVSLLNSNEDIDHFGGLLNESWRLKRQLSTRISPPFVDELYEVAIEAGALGGKLLGAGGGGFMLFYVPTHKRDEVLRAIGHLLVVPFQFENSGSQIIYFNPSH